VTIDGLHSDDKWQNIGSRSALPVRARLLGAKLSRDCEEELNTRLRLGKAVRLFPGGDEFALENFHSMAHKARWTNDE
jgi:hypothetical protein